MLLRVVVENYKSFDHRDRPAMKSQAKNNRKLNFHIDGKKG